MDKISSPKRILEIGPGTGSVTVVLLEKMTDSDSLTVCEINPRFMKALKKRLASDPNYIRHRDRVVFFQGAVQDMPPSQPFDAVICAVPFNNFNKETTAAIFEKARGLSTSQACMSYYEYMAFRHFSKIAPSTSRRRCIREVENYLHDEWMPRLVRRDTVWRNMPPIYVYLLQLTDQNPGQCAAAAV